MEFTNEQCKPEEENSASEYEDEGDEEDEEGEPVCCSYALTGDRSIFQGVYRCLTCTTEAESNKCCCAGCADACHWEHDVEYLGYGLAYCDCGAGSCELFGDSKILAERVLRTTGTAHIAHDREGRIAGNSGIVVDEFAEFRWESIMERDIRLALEEQAAALVQFSKETFWLEAGSQPRCALEAIAAEVFARHTRGCQLDSSVSSGAEWWVQVKPCNSVLPDGSLDGTSGVASAIDLHYDKDEMLAERFSVGVYPQISTVTYITCGNLSFDPEHDEEGGDVYSNTAPTVVVDNTTIHPIGRGMNKAFISRPAVGKHISFDGRYLHGVPSHQALRRIRSSRAAAMAPEVLSGSPIPSGEGERKIVEDELRYLKEDAEKEQLRITILVNVWIGHHPASVDPLSEEIISFLPEVLPETMSRINPLSADSSVENIMPIRDIPIVTVYRNPPLPSATTTRRPSTTTEAVVIAGPDTGELLKLPFVSSDATWGKEDDEEADLILKMWLPDLTAAFGREEDTVQINYINNLPPAGTSSAEKKKKKKRSAREGGDAQYDPLCFLAYDV